ncbi:hypothetical protein BN1423_1530005 [Carnobacterium maltaromaticum]|nr:hypothetical protein BN1423_1530005 [Carnobacterium maltaromaticum]
MKAVVPYMKKAGQGSIVNTASYTALVGAGINGYTGSKGSIRAVSKAAAADLGYSIFELILFIQESLRHRCLLLSANIKKLWHS